MISSRFKTFLTTFTLFSVLVGCSQAVDDEIIEDNALEEISADSDFQNESRNKNFASKTEKNTKIDKIDEKYPLVSGEDTFNYTSLKILDNEDEYANKNEIYASAKRYSMQLCLDLRVNRSMKSIPVYITHEDGSRKREFTDTRGCIYWVDKIDLDYKLIRQRERFIKVIQTSNSNKALAVRYTIEPFNNHNLVDRSRSGFDQDDNGAFNVRVPKDQMIIMTPIKAIPTDYGDIHPRNDILEIERKAEFRTCILRNLSRDQKILDEKVTVILERKYSDDELKALEKIGAKPFRKVAKNIDLLESCVTLNIAVDHQRYTNTRRIPYIITIKTESDRFKGAVAKRKICLYPWSSSGWSFNGNQENMVTECPKDKVNKQASIFIPKVEIDFEGHPQKKAYTINKNLDLSVRKTYTFTFYPMIDHGNFLHQEETVVKLHNGRYRLKALIVAPKEGQIDLSAEDLAEKKYVKISSASKIINVKNNIVMERLNFDIKFKDLPYVHTRTFMILRVEDLKDGHPYAPIASTTVGMFHASNKSFNSKQYKRIENDAKKNSITKSEELIQEAFQEEEESFKTEVNELLTIFDGVKTLDNPLFEKWNKEGSLENAFEKYTKKSRRIFGNNFIDLSLADLKTKTKYEIDAFEMDKLLDDNYTRDTMRKLCKVLFTDEYEDGMFSRNYVDHNYKNCLREPEVHMDIHLYDHIESIDPKPELLDSVTVNISTSTGRNTSHGTSDRISTSRRLSYGGKFGAKLDLPMIFGAGFDFGFDVSKMWGHDMQTSYYNRSDSGTNVPISADSLTLRFGAKSKRCIIIDGTVKLSNELKLVFPKNSNNGIGAPSTEYALETNQVRYRFCDSKSRARTLQETWYYIGEGHQFHSILRDRQNLEENPYTMLIRGKRNMSVFLDFLQKFSKELLQSKIKTTHSADEHLSGSYAKFQAMTNVEEHHVYDGGMPGTVLVYDKQNNSDDQYYGEQPVEDFDVNRSPWGMTYEKDLSLFD